MKKTIKATVYTFAFLAGSYATAYAFPANMITAGLTSQPIGHYEYCKTNKSDCGNINGSTSPVRLTEDNWKTILKVNYTVNTKIQPMTDMQIYGVEEKWAIPTVAGDCEDYALLKRKLLIQSGISASDLPMTVVLQPNGEGHAVLTVRTDRGDFILDNMRNRVLLWSQTEYRFLKRQSDSNSGKWVKIDDGHDVVVGSVR
jgi:predicted transglutaminase-like cysteine proteinase